MTDPTPESMERAERFFVDYEGEPIMAPDESVEALATLLDSVRAEERAKNDPTKPMCERELCQGCSIYAEFAAIKDGTP